MIDLKHPKCSLKGCEIEVKKHGLFCCKEHQDKYWGEGKPKKLTIKEMQERILGWRGKRKVNDLMAEREELRRIYTKLKDEMARIVERGKQLNKEIGDGHQQMIETVEDVINKPIW